MAETPTATGRHPAHAGPDPSRGYKVALITGITGNTAAATTTTANMEYTDSHATASLATVASARVQQL